MSNGSSNPSTINATTNALILLPEHLILEHILPRLPAKTLIRFKSVSKSWHSEISSSKFAKLRLNFSPFYSNQFIIHTRNNVSEYKLMLLPYDELNNRKTPVQLNYCFPQNVRIVGSCHGLLCLFNICPTGNSFSICNPATNQSRDIALPDPLNLANGAKSWFGCPPSTEDYKIVVSLYECYVYSFRTESWKLISELGQFLRYHKLSNMTAPINDLLYWSPFWIKNQGQPKRIVALDLVNDQVKEFPWMEWLSAYTNATFFLTSGCLSLHCCSDRTSDVWILKQHDNWSSWEKSYSVLLGGWTVLNVTPTGKFLVFDCLKKRFKLIDPSENAQDQSQSNVYTSENADPGGRVLGVVEALEGYVETLISPFKTIKFSVEEGHEI